MMCTKSVQQNVGGFVIVVETIRPHWENEFDQGAAESKLAPSSQTDQYQAPKKVPYYISLYSDLYSEQSFGDIAWMLISTPENK